MTVASDAVRCEVRPALIKIKATSSGASYGDQQWSAIAMAKLHSHLWRLSVAAAGAVLLSAGPSLGQSVPIPCSAFARQAYGWKVLAPVMLEIADRLRAVALHRSPERRRD
jgi:hypothetical protein